MKTPTETRPKITNTDIRDGFVTRYFTQMVSTKKIYEIDNTQYDIFVNNPYYITIKLSWTISGNINTDTINGQRRLGLLDKNRETVDYYNKTMPGLNKKLRNPGEYNFGKNNQTDQYDTMVTNTIDGYTPTTVSDTIVEPVPDLVTSGMVLYYDAGNLASYPGSGSVITDLSGFGYNTSIVQIPTQITFDSANSGSFKFDPGTETSGNQACIALPMNSNMPWNNSDITAMTLSFWTKFNSTLYTDATLFGYSAGSGGARFQLVYNGTNMVVNRAVVAEVGKFLDYTVTRNVITNMVLTKSASQYSLYVNGTLVSQFTSAATYTVGSSCLGQNFNNSAPVGNKSIQKMNGNIYNFITYNTALSAADVLQNYKAQKARFGL